MTPYEFCKTVVLISIGVFMILGSCWFGGNLVGSGGKSYNMYFGKYKPMIIVSESMIPSIAVNGIVLIEEIPYEDLKVGDIILFKTDRYGLICHRIVMKNGAVFTKGDHNQTVDYWSVSPEMYKGRVYAIHNEFSGIITFLFGDLNNLNLARVLFGFFIMFLCIVAFIYFLIFLFHLICIYFFLRKSSKYGGDFVIKQYYPRLSNTENVQELIKIFDDFGSKKNFRHKWRIRWKILKLHNSVMADERSHRKAQRMFKEFKIDIDKFGIK